MKKYISAILFCCMMGNVAFAAGKLEPRRNPVKKPIVEEIIKEQIIEPEVIPDVIQKIDLKALLTDIIVDPVPATPTPADPLAFMKGAGGRSGMSLFTGGVTFNYPIQIPPGRKGMSPSISLQYSSQSNQFNSILGLGWSLSLGSIVRSTNKGVNTLYTENTFTAEINGQNMELVSIDPDDDLYGAKIEGEFMRFIFKENSWIVMDKQGTKYFFGLNETTRQSDPADTTKIYKWMLERVEDLNGNFMTFSYVSHLGQVYPDTVKYTGFGSNEGMYEVKFILGDRSAYTEYKRGFAVTTEKIIDSVEVYFKERGDLALIYEYDLEYDFQNSAVTHLTKITQKKDVLELPPTQFSYYTGSESEPNKKIHLLKKIQFPYGGIEEFTYRPSTANRIGNMQANPLPFVIHTVYEVKKKVAENYPEYTTHYEYEGGHYYYDNLDAYKKEYAGFQKTKATDSAGHMSVSYFHQSEFSPDNNMSSSRGEFQDHVSKKGRVFREELWDKDNNLQTVFIKKWNREVLPEERSFVFLERETAIDYDGNDSLRAKAKTSQYDEYGNTVSETDYGEVELLSDDGSFTDTGADKRVTNTSYIYDTQKYLYSFPFQEEIRDIQSNIIGETLVYYDDLEIEKVGKGNMTANKKRADSDTLLKTMMQYDQYGLPVLITNPRGNTTKTTYDSYGLLPFLVENALGYITEFEYDYRFGVQSFVMDPNNAKAITEYDDFGRVLRILISDPENGERNIVKQAFVYNFANYPVSIMEAKYVGTEKMSLDTHTYFDGFARPIQVRTEAERDFVVAHTEYDSRGNILKEHLPIFSEGKEYTVPARTTYGTTYIYDAQNRPMAVTTPVGTTYFHYDNWNTEITDALGNKKDFLYDAQKKLVGVNEYLDTQKYTTNYTYNSIGHLAKITDAQGNEKRFTYNFLGQKLSEELLHRPLDTFGRFEFRYDENGNVLSKKNPNSNEITWTYDNLDRVVTEDSLRTTGIEVQYKYDEGVSGIGHLTSVTSGGAVDKYQYDVLGRMIHETRTLKGYEGDFETSYSYDLQGKLRTVLFPKKNELNIQANYLYNQAGKLESLSYRDLDTGISNPVITNLDYTPIGSIAQIDFVNGVQMKNTFDIAKLYYMTDKVTTKDSVDLQSLHYTYDDVGNILNIEDISHTNTAKNSGYGYDDLYRLVSATITNTANQQDYSHTFEYDIIGNILNKSNVGTYIYEGGNNSKITFGTRPHPHAVTSVGDTHYIYDENGNLTSDGTRNYTWNYNNQISHSSNGTLNVDYHYDHAKKRVSKIPNGEFGTFYVNQYYDTESNQPKLYFYAGNSKVATLSLDKSDRRMAYHHEDHLTGSNVDTNEDGKINQVLDYFPYGDVRIDEQEGSFDNDYKFTGKEKDDETGLYYYGSRYYDSAIGRFVGIDPWSGDLSDPQTLNKYAYVLNNPLKYVDPSGEKVELVAKQVAWKGVHTFLRVTPDNPKDFGLNESFSFTLGGYTKNGLKNLEARVNSPSDTLDLHEYKILETRQITSLNKDIGDTKFINNLLGAYGRYDNNNMESYSIGAFGNEYNCNAFTNSLLHASGAGGIPSDFNPPNLNPGIDKTIPSMIMGIGRKGSERNEFQQKVIQPAQKKKKRKKSKK